MTLKTLKSDGTNRKKIISYFIGKLDSKSYPKEMKLAKKILDEYNFDFLIQMKEPFYPIKMNSLAWFLSEYGQKYLKCQYFEYSKKNINLTYSPEKVKLNKDSFGENLEIKNNPKTLQDFLGMFKENKNYAKN